ncbi:hypothetical protein ACFO9Q_22290 [Paenibacillus sp. GCM10023252]|uniref:hypothetical protein n=1 Tax=Paenibacillus sp. GCM10023252 TaxID=3252649 RepID=UPI0036164017
MLAYIIVGITVAFYVWEIRESYDASRKKDLVIGSIILLTAIVIGELVNQSIAVPNPLDGITYVFGPVSKMLDNMLK